MTCPSTSATSTRPALSPFDGFTGDLTLQSSDGVEFHCFSQILVVASPVFEGMVAVGNPTPDSSNSANHRPIVPLTEDSKTLDFLLRFIYPISKPSQPRLLEDIEPLLEASMKYIMEYPTTALTQELLAFAQSRAMQVWAIGCRLTLEEVARTAAERMLQYKTLGSYTHLQQFVPIDEFIRTADARGVTVADYYRLWTYHRRRGKVEEGFSFTCPLPREDQDRPVDLNVPWDFFLFDVTLSDATCFATDGMAFPVHAGLLCMSSPVLKENILEARHRTTTLGSDQSHYRIQLTDESPVLAHLLHLCYPGDAPLPADHRLFLAILKAAESYGMTRIVDLLYAKWDSVAGVRPALAYFAALEHGLPEIARVAALKISPESSALYVPEMENTPAIYWQRLKDYWAAAEAAVDRVQRTSERLWCTKTAATVPLSLTFNRGIDLQRLNDYWTTAEADRVQKTSGCTKSAATAPLSLRINHGESRCQARGSVWMRECRNEVLADVRRKLVAQEMPTVEELMQRSVAPTLTEKPWCAGCSDVARDIVRLGATLREKMISELDEVPLIV
ncbi:hypothetical protein V8D89_009764 [Ganoderma adspersum]